MEAEKDKAEPTNISTQVKNSLATTQTETPQEITCKSEAKGQLHLITASREQMAELYDYVQSIGADKQLLSDHPDEDKQKERNQMLFNKWFQTLVIRNGRFPRDIPIRFVLAHFSHMVVQGNVDIHGYNLRAQVQAFHEYLDTYENQLRGKWWQHQNPDQRPKTLPETATKSQEEEELDAKGRKELIESLYGADKVPESLKKFT